MDKETTAQTFFSLHLGKANVWFCIFVYIFDECKKAKTLAVLKMFKEAKKGTYVCGVHFRLLPIIPLI